MCNKYNGWTNRETWLISVWDILEGYKTATTNVYHLSDELKEYFNDLFYDQIPKEGLMSDLVGGAINKIDWYEHAEHLIDEMKLEEEEDY